MQNYTKPYPWIDPVLIKIGFVEVRWYSLAYIIGFFCAYRIVKYLDSRYNNPQALNPKTLESLFNFSIISVILGGRIGYVVFYNLSYYLQNPISMLKVWEGGMSFHGAVIGLVICFTIFAKRNNISFLKLTDLLCASVGPGIMLGRIANFINGELWGRPCGSDGCFLGFIFPASGSLDIRYASQLYESFFEGFCIFVILFALIKMTKIFQIKGAVSSLFFILYGVFRFFIEFIREPDEQVGLLFNTISMGQGLCLLMISIGIFVFCFSIIKYFSIKATQNN